MFKFNKQQGVVSIIVVFSIGIFALGSVLIIAQGALQQLVQNRNAVSSSQAFYAAEANASEGIYQVIGFDTGTPYILNNAMGSIVVTSFGYGDLLISGIAQKGTVNREVVNVFRKFPEGQAFKYGIYTPSTINLSGNVTIDGDIFAEGGINIEGSAVVIGEEVDDLSATPPEFDAGPFIASASETNTFFDNAAAAVDYLAENPEAEAVIYVQGEEEITTIENSHINLNGTLWVEGHLILKGGTFTAAESCLAIVVQKSLIIEGNVTINGIVYVKGSTSFSGSGNATINGLLISGGDTNAVIEVTGKVQITYPDDDINFWEDVVDLLAPLSYPLEKQIIRWDEN